ncbi:MAG: tyrosine-type recombinase/integrase [Candidatus Omnitrophica bacterium]|nr:tyrosine-type recombinase/integrase [Candidatus Omnitrophota bacterium]
MKVIESQRKVKGKYRKVYIADYRDARGKRPRPWYLTKYEAERELTRLRDLRFQAKNKKGGISANIDHWLFRYLEILENEGKSQKTINRYRKILVTFLEWLKDNYRGIQFLDEITADHLDEYLSFKRKTPSEKTNRLNAETTLYLTLKVIKQFFNKAVGRSKIESNPLKAVKMKKPKAKRNRSLTSEETESIYKNAHGIIRDIAIFAIHTGLRENEICELKKEDIDLVENVLNIRGKGDKDRIVPIHKEAEVIIKKYYHKAHIYLFENSHTQGARFNGPSLYKRLLRLYRLLGIDNANFHTLRNTFATEADYKGRDRLAVEMILGHRSEEYVTGRYLHANIDRMRKVINSIDYAQK